MSRKTTLTTALFATLAAGVLSAAPATAGEKISFSLSYSDLDLDTTAGVTELQERIHMAGRKACGIRVGSQRNTLLQLRQERACYEAVVNAALERVEETSDLHLADVTVDDASSANSES